MTTKQKLNGFYALLVNFRIRFCKNRRSQVRIIDAPNLLSHVERNYVQQQDFITCTKLVYSWLAYMAHDN
jgi:hypothetical protein